MEKEFIPYEIALALKELGFDRDCFALWSGFDEKNFTVTDTIRLFSSGFRIDGTQSSICYVNDFNSRRVAAPTFSQAFRFLREKYKLNSFIIDSKSYDWYFNINDMVKDDVVSEVLYFKSYEEAELECLKKLIEIVKNKT